MGKILDDLKSYFAEEVDDRIFETGSLFVPVEKWERMGEAFSVLSGGYIPKGQGVEARFKVLGTVDLLHDGIQVEWILEGGDEGLAEKLIGYLNREVDLTNIEPGREVVWISRASSRKKNAP